MSDFCCRTFFVPAVPDPAGLYGAICAAVPPCYLCGQGFSNSCLRFGLEGGLQAELRFYADRCEVWLRHCPPDKGENENVGYQGHPYRHPQSQACR